MEGCVTVFSPENTAGASQENAALISQTIEANGNQVSNVKKYNIKQ